MGLIDKMQVIYYDSYHLYSGNNKNPNLIFMIDSDVVKWHSDNKYKYFKDNVHILDIDFSKVVNNKINLSKIFDLGIGDEGIIHNKIIYDSEIDIYIEHIYNIMKYNAIDKIGSSDINVQIECILKNILMIHLVILMNILILLIIMVIKYQLLIIDYMINLY